MVRCREVSIGVARLEITCDYVLCHRAGGKRVRLLRYDVEFEGAVLGQAFDYRRLLRRRDEGRGILGAN